MTIKFGEWISVDEALPPFQTKVILLIHPKHGCGNKSEIEVGELNSDGRFSIWFSSFIIDQEGIEEFYLGCEGSGYVTHWMPIPHLPESLKDE